MKRDKIHTVEYLGAQLPELAQMAEDACLEALTYLLRIRMAALEAACTVPELLQPKAKRRVTTYEFELIGYSI